MSFGFGYSSSSILRSPPSQGGSSSPLLVSEDFATFQSRTNQFLLNTDTPEILLPDVTMTIMEDINFDYIGPVTGTTDIPNPLLYRVQMFTVADIAYDNGSVDLSPTGDFAFVRSFVGGKQFRIVRKSDDAWVHTLEYPLLLRSYRIPKPPETPVLTYNALIDRTFLYDQAVGVCAFVAQDHPDRHRLTAGLCQAIGAGGELPFAVNRLSGVAADAYYRTGSSAWVMYALAFYLSKNPQGSAATTAAAKLQLCLDWNQQFLVTNPVDNRVDFYTGGKGRYIGDTFDPDYLIPWVATEHLVDLYFLFDLVSTLGLASSAYYLGRRNAIANGMLTRLWDEDQGRFWQGITPDGPDYAAALDQSSWGGIMLVHLGEMAKALRAYAYIQNFAWRTPIAEGYTPYNPDLGYPSTVRGVWSEGTAGVALFERALNYEPTAAETLVKMKGNKDPEFGYLYISDRDISNQLEPWVSTASNGWAVLAHNPNGFWRVNKGQIALGVVTTTLSPIV